MDYEKSYKEALERAKQYYQTLKEADDYSNIARLENIFPELKESEDEKIRKGLIKIIQNLDGGYPFEKYGTIKRDVLAWLEKQKEQKPAEWSKEDENAYKWVYNLFEKSNDAWFEVVFKGCYPKVTRDAVLAMLKSLRPQSHWKPSDGMLEALKWAKCEFHPDSPEHMKNLECLYTELKALAK